MHVKIEKNNDVELTVVSRATIMSVCSRLYGSMNLIGIEIESGRRGNTVTNLEHYLV